MTAPFKDDACAFAERFGMVIGENARRARAVNTLIPSLADNTDVDGFAALIPRDAKRAAVIGAGTALKKAIAIASALT